MSGSSHLPLVVVKVGGSLFDWPELPDRLNAYLETRREDRVLMIAGGGAITDQIRAFDRVHRLGDPTAHWLAINSMDLSARMLAALLPGIATIERLDQVREFEGLAVLVPKAVIEEIDQLASEALPAGWDITSDSIAAWVAGYLGASDLVLLKSAGVPAGSTRRSAVQMGVVDPMFETSARCVPRVEIVNLRDDGGSAGVLLE